MTKVLSAFQKLVLSRAGAKHARQLPGAPHSLAAPRPTRGLFNGAPPHMTYHNDSPRPLTYVYRVLPSSALNSSMTFMVLLYKGLKGGFIMEHSYVTLYIIDQHMRNDI